KKRQHQKPVTPDSEVKIEVPLKQVRTPKNAPVEYWTRKKKWPRRLFEFCPEEWGTRSVPTNPGFIQLLTSTSTAISEAKSDAYFSDTCIRYLKSKGCYIVRHMSGLAGIADEDKQVCQKLLKRDSVTPTHTMTVFDDDALEYVVSRGPIKNETGVIRLIAQCIVPSAELEMCRGRLGSLRLIESINEPWIKSSALQHGVKPVKRGEQPQSRLPTPQPDYAAGFSKQGLTMNQREKLKPLLGQSGETSVLQGTENMIFPFLTAEVKSSTVSLELADRQNTHSITRAMRGVVELFKIVGREDELHRRILGFSIVHDHAAVEVYAHYPIMGPEQTQYYRDEVMPHKISRQNKALRWASYNFVLGVYHHWAQQHYDRLRSAIDQLPEEIDFSADGRTIGRATIPTTAQDSIHFSHEGSLCPRPRLQTRQREGSS
ncbi:hypothetical protein BO94DRAFT_478986, partial [Aspergillus sclerotioniger CBS 115572]